MLFLGAGASKEATDEAKNTPPDANELRDLIAQEFFKKEMKNRDLMQVAEMAIGVSGGRPQVYQYIKTILEPFKISKTHECISTYQWKMICTTNYDLILEESYANNEQRVQNIVPFVKDAQPIDNLLRESENGVQYIKLHGCLNHVFDADCPLILSQEQYNSFSKNRKFLFNRLEDAAAQSVVLFAGYRLDDAHLRRLVYDLPSDQRPRWYMISPGAEAEDIHFWSSKNIEIIPTTLGEFMRALNADIPALMRAVPVPDEVKELAIRTHYARPALESTRLNTTLQNDLVHVHAGMPTTEQDPRKFFSGHDTGWGGILNDLDVRRKVEERVLLDVIIEDTAAPEPELHVLRGSGGAGKSIALKRIAFDAATELESLCLWLRRGCSISHDALSELHALTQRPIYLFIDEIALHLEQVSELLNSARQNRVPLRIIGAERDSDWFSYCGPLESLVDVKQYRVGHLSEAEVNQLLDLLATHNALGLLEGHPREEQVREFMDAGRADRQLLVALHELTQGKPFADIVFEEFERVTPATARQLYLDVATLHQFKSGIRAGTISRISGITFTDFQDRFLNPLFGLIKTITDRYTGDVSYYTRHSRVAEIIFNRAMKEDASIVSQVCRIIGGIDIGYSSDKKALLDLIRGRSLSEKLRHRNSGREIFLHASNVFGESAWILQQSAIFELHHKHGDIDEAVKIIEKSSSLEPNNFAIRHTKAEISRQKANAVKSNSVKDSFRSQCRSILNSIPSENSYKATTRCKLLVDEAIDLANSLGDDISERDGENLDAAIDLAQSSLERAQAQFSDHPEFLQIEARLASALNEEEKAFSALLAAWKAGAKGTGTAIKVAGIHTLNGNHSDAVSILKDALARHPDDRAAHLALARALVRESETNLETSTLHARRASSLGDTSYSSRMYLAQLLFKAGQYGDSRDLFSEIDQNADPGLFKKTPAEDNEITATIQPLRGRVSAIKSSYLFVSDTGYPDSIFVHNSNIDTIILDSISVGDSVKVKIRFNRVGPVGVSLII